MMSCSLMVKYPIKHNYYTPISFNKNIFINKTNEIKKMVNIFVKINGLYSSFEH